MKIQQKRSITILLVTGVLVMSVIAGAENIDPDNTDLQYAYGENIGWIDWEGFAGSGVHVYDTYLDGYIWGENVGWINTWYQIGGSGPDTGVVNDGNGNLSGYAWGENIGWIHLQASVEAGVAKTAVNQMTINWNSRTGGIYDMYSSTDLVSWSLEQAGIASGGATTSWVDYSATGSRKFYRLEQMSPPGYGVKTAW